MKLLLIGLLMLLCGCTAEPYAEMEAIPTTVEENWILSHNYARREESHLPEGATSYTLPLRSDSRNTMCFEDWSLQRYYDGQWYDMQNCGGELDLTLESYRDAGVDLVPIELEFPPLLSGYYRIAVSIEGAEGALCSEFAVGSLAKLCAADLPASQYELSPDVKIQVVIPQRVGYGATDVLYYMEAGASCTTGCFSMLEREIDGQWCELPAPENNFELVATYLDPGHTLYERICLYYHLFPLEPGHYRIIEEVRRDKRGEDLYIAGEFDVLDVPHEDLAVRVPEGLTMEVTDLGQQTHEPWEKGWARDCWVELTITNNTDETVFLRSEELTRHELQESQAAQHGHDHIWRLRPGESRVQKVEMVRSGIDRDSNFVPILDENGPYALGGAVKDGTYTATRKVIFEDGRWCVLDCEFTVRDAALVPER